ncbi:MAG: hypothetical protein UY50_C0019G0012 [Parcubacteria group bacterium GW2011_GWA2_49_9]|nr:MAG: hypothetical protein UY50_C0019G0012 [Parcubacteria group bacterium GW2011_GWA2_49_9]
MEGFWSSVSSWWSEKTNSPLYFTYLGFLAVWNWKFFQVIFLESADLFSTPRIEYVKSALLFSVPVPESIPIWISGLIDWLANFSWHLMPPIIFTYLAIVYLPKLNAWAFDIHLTNHFSRKSAYRVANLAYEKGMEQSMKEVLESKDRQIQTQQKIQKKEKTLQKTLTDKERWEIEYNEFEKHPLFSKFQEILTSVYKHNGVIEYADTLSFRNKEILSLGADIKAVADAKKLITITDSDGNVTKIALTDKGRFFAEKYLETYSLI